MQESLAGLWHGLGVATQLHNLLWCFVGVMVGNFVGVLPGLGVLSAVSILLPLTFGMKPVAAILMLAGIGFLTVVTAVITAAFLESVRRRMGDSEQEELLTKLDDVRDRLDAIESALRR